MSYANEDREHTNKWFDIAVKVIRLLWDDVDGVCSTENHNTDFERELDQKWGIDAVIRFTNSTYLPISLRIQDGIDYRSFTVRTSRDTHAPTEFSKRDNEIRKRIVIRPSGLLQIYLDYENHVTSAGYIEWREIIRYCNYHLTPLDANVEVIDRDGSVQRMHRCFWCEMKKYGFRPRLILP